MGVAWDLARSAGDLITRVTQPGSSARKLALSTTVTATTETPKTRARKQFELAFISNAYLPIKRTLDVVFIESLDLPN